MQRHSNRQSSSDLFFRRLWHCPQPDPRQILVGLQEICSSALDDLKQVIHRRHFLELLGEEPLQEIDRDIVVLLARQSHESVDLLGDMNFLIERKLYRIARCLEFRFRRVDRGDHHAPASIDNIFYETQRVTFFFLGLLKEMLRQLRQRLSRKMRADRVILERGAKFISDLFIDRIDNLLTRKHNEDSSPDYPRSSSDYGATCTYANA